MTIPEVTNLKIEAKEWQIQFAAHVIRHGGVIAYPTETVWGLGCDPFNELAVRRLLSLKNRAQEKGLILITGQVEQLEPMLKGLSPELKSRFIAPQTEPTTWLVPDVNDLIPDFVKGRFSSVATRLTEYAVVSRLTHHFGGPIVSTSANKAGKEPATSVFKLRQVFGAELDYILPAPLGGFSKPSTIRDLTTGAILRP